MVIDPDPTEAGRASVRLLASLLQPRSMMEGLQRFLEEVLRTLSAAVSVGVCLVRRRGTLTHLAGAGPLAADVHQAQANTRQGPCPTAGRTGRPVLVDDLAAERRWPGFTGRACALGLASMLAFPLVMPASPSAVLSVHATVPAAFDAGTVRLLSDCSVPLSLAVRHVAQTDSLRQALETRQVIGEATGILMERHRIDSVTAFEQLAHASQRLNTKLRVIAEHLLLTGQDPATLTIGDLFKNP